MCAAEPANPWDEYADGWDDDLGARAYASAAYGSLVDICGERGLSLTGATVCDFGCGTGLLTERLAAVVRSIDAVDTSAAMLAVLSAKIEMHGMTNVYPSMVPPASLATHDIVVCSSVLGFVDDYAATVHGLVRLLRPPGLFVQWDWERDEDATEPHGLGRAEVNDALTGAGLDAVEVDTAFEVAVEGETMRPLMGIGQKR